jgi:hypothetical protein
MGKIYRCPQKEYTSIDILGSFEEPAPGVHPVHRASATARTTLDKASSSEAEDARLLQVLPKKKVGLSISKQERGCAQAPPSRFMTLFISANLVCTICFNMPLIFNVIMFIMIIMTCKKYVPSPKILLSLITLVQPTKGRTLGDAFSNNQLTQILSSDDDHYLVFDQVGLMASTTTYMHVMLPLNFSSVMEQIHAVNYSLNQQFTVTNLYKEHGYYQKQTLEHQTRTNIAALTRRLNIAKAKLETLNLILPKVQQKQHRFQRDTSTEFPLPTEQTPDNFLHIDHPHLTRHKRWLLSLLQGVVGTFMGLYTNYQLKTISNRVQNMEITQNLLIHLTRQHSWQLERLVNVTGTLRNQLIHYTTINPQIIYIEFDEVVTQVEERVTRLVNVVQQLQHRRLAVDWLTQPQLEALHKTIIAYTDEHNYALLTTHPSDYFQLELSYLRNEDGVLALLHIPCTTTPDLMTIMRYIPFPIPLDSPTRHSPYSVDQAFNVNHNLLSHSLNSTISKNEALYLIAEADLIAIDGDSRFRLLTQSDFAACIQRNHIYLCDKQQILGTDLPTTCLGSLYQKDPTGVRNNCRFERRPLREEVFQMDVNEFLVFSPSPYVSRVHCNNGTSFTADFGQTTRLSVPNGCSIELKSHVLRVEDSIQVPLPASITSWRWDPLSLPADLLDNLPHIDSALSNISSILASIQEDNSTLLHIHNLTQKLSSIQNTTYPDFVSDTIEHHLSSSGSSMSIVLWLGFVVSVLAFIAGVIFTYRQCIMSQVLKSFTNLQYYMPASQQPPASPNPEFPLEQELQSVAPIFFHAHPPKPKPRRP